MPKKSLLATSCLGCFGIVALGMLLLFGFSFYFIKREVDYFSEHRDEIIASVKTDLEDGNFALVVAKADKYSIAGDPELVRFKSIAEKELKGRRISELKSELATSNQLESRAKILEELQSLVPDDELIKNQITKTRIELLSKELNSGDSSDAAQIRILKELGRIDPQSKEWQEALVKMQTRKLSGHIRYECKVHSEPDENSKIVGYLTPPSSADVIDTGGDWLRLKFGPIKNLATGEFLDLPFDSELFIKRSYFTTEIPANW